MGVKNWDFIPWRTVSLDELAPRIIAIDAPNYLTRRIMSFEFKRKKSFERIPTAHINLVMGMTRIALKKKILPVFIFDGPPESLKRPLNPDLVRTAGELFQAYKEKLDVFDSTIAERLVKSPALRWYFSVNHIKELCNALGVPAITAPSEAEMLAAVLCKEDLVGTVLSNDADALLFGSPHVTKALHLTKDEIERCTLADLQSAVDLDIENLRDLAIISGCDFHDGIKGIGPRKGTIQLQRFGNLEGLLKSKGYTVTEQNEFMKAREVFDEPNYLSSNGISLRLNPPVVSRVLEILKPIMSSERAEKFAKQSVHLWREFGREQTTLKQWIS